MWTQPTRLMARLLSPKASICKHHHQTNAKASKAQQASTSAAHTEQQQAASWESTWGTYLEIQDLAIPLSQLSLQARNHVQCGAQLCAPCGRQSISCPGPSILQRTNQDQFAAKCWRALAMSMLKYFKCALQGPASSASPHAFVFHPPELRARLFSLRLSVAFLGWLWLARQKASGLSCSCSGRSTTSPGFDTPHFCCLMLSFPVKSHRC